MLASFPDVIGLLHGNYKSPTSNLPVSNTQTNDRSSFPKICCSFRLLGGLFHFFVNFSLSAYMQTKTL